MPPFGGAASNLHTPTLPGQTITMVQCCDDCLRESNASGIARHRKHCNEYKVFTAKRHAFGLHLAEAKLEYQRAKALQAQAMQLEQQEPVSMETDDTVSVSFIHLSSEVPYKL